ncbi:PAS domain-containing sensor histidine kinase [Brevibacillus dissolubilis]|uniref:PAS domain-containing sensor histidine kinase n=1 Tax=Brevibacillus dissolubilis TaxID=1844116 RepID=UPI001116B985|nr:PAS domain-containing protein [Brevibacillus dissolubilis]
MKFHQAAGFLLLTCLAVLGNMSGLSMSVGADFFFGSVFVFLILRFYGLWAGLLVTVAASIGPALISGHPYTALIHLCETLFVGICMRDPRTRNLIVSVSIFWMIVGIPLAYLFYYHVLEFPWVLTNQQMLKDMLGSIGNATVAYLLMHHLPLTRWMKLPNRVRSSGRIGLRQVFFGIMVSFVIFPSMFATLYEGREENRLIEQRIIHQIQQSTWATTQFFQYGADLPLKSSEMVAVVMDEHGKMITSRLTSMEGMQELAFEEQGRVEQVDLNIYHWMPDDDRPALMKWADSIYYSKQTIQGKSERPWTLFVKISIRPYLEETYQKYNRFLLLSLMGTFGTILAAGLLSGYMSRIFTNLHAATANIPERVQKEEQIDWPESNVHEMHSLIGNMKQMTETIQLHMQEVQSERSRLEELIPEILDSVHDVVWSVTPDFDRVLYISPSVESVWGISPEEVVLDPACWLKKIHPEDEAKVLAVMSELQETDRLNISFRIIGPAGEVKWIYSKSRVIRDQNQKPLRIVGINTDMTKEKATEAKMQTMMRELSILNGILEQRVQDEVQKNREKDHLLIHQSRFAAVGEMIGHIAHQWRQPLNSIGLIIQDVKEAYEYGEIDQEYLEESTRESMRLIKHMSDTIDDFRNFFNPNKEKYVLSPAEMVRRGVSIFNPEIKHGEINVTYDIQDDLRIVGNPNEFNQVLLNFFQNSKQAFQERKTQEKEIHIVGFEYCGQVVIQFEDTAGGIPEEIIGKVFDPYFTTKQEGTGIGLYMCKTIVEENLGGKIAATNTERGALLTLFLPMYQPESDGEGEVARESVAKISS